MIRQNLILIALSLFALNALASSPAAKPVSFATFQKAAHQAEKDLGSDMPCSFTAKETAKGLLLQLISDKENVKVLIPKGTPVTLTDEMPDSDGSVETYEAKGLAILTVTNASDAFFRIDLGSNKKTASCEIDF